MFILWLSSITVYPGRDVTVWGVRWSVLIICLTQWPGEGFDWGLIYSRLAFEHICREDELNLTCPHYSFCSTLWIYQRPWFLAVASFPFGWTVAWNHELKSPSISKSLLSVYFARATDKGTKAGSLKETLKCLRSQLWFGDLLTCLASEVHFSPPKSLWLGSAIIEIK